MSDATLWTRLPGITILALVALGAGLVAGGVPGLNALVIAVIVGALLTNGVGMPTALEPGLETSSLFLSVAVVLLGGSFSLGALATVGPLVVLLVLVAVAVGVLGVIRLARALDLREEVGALLAAGGSVCGVAAVVAVADVLDAEETDVAAVVATVVLLDAALLVVLPIAGAVLGLPARQFGVWAGLTLLSTGPVAAAGFVYAPVAGQWAVLTKLVGNLAVGGVVLAYGATLVDRDEEADLGVLWTEFPTVLVGFLVVALFANSGLLDASSLDLLGNVTDWFFLLAFAGLGFQLRFDRMRATAPLLVAVLLAQAVVVGALVLLAVRLLGL